MCRHFFAPVYSARQLQFRFESYNGTIGNSSDSNLGRCPKLKSESSSEVPFCVMRSFHICLIFCVRSREIAGSIIGGRARPMLL